LGCGGHDDYFDRMSYCRLNSYFLHQILALKVLIQVARE